MLNKIGFLFNLLIYIFIIIVIPLILSPYLGNWSTEKDRFKKRAKKRVKKRVDNSIIMPIIYLLAVIYLIPDTIKYCRDIPAFITKNYQVEVGAVSDSYDGGGKPDYTVYIVNGIELKGTINYKDKNCYAYKFYYLPNTHWIMLYEGYK